MIKSKDLQVEFSQDIAPKLQAKLGLKNSMAVPKITKITINSGLGPHIQKGNKNYDYIVENLAKISGQKPVLNKAKKSVSNFKIREGDVVGTSVILRGKRMYCFLSKLINIVFPRVRDFRGIPKKGFDGQGNYNIGFKEHTVFAEISPDDVMHLHGLQICVKTTATDNETGFELLKALGFPFKKEQPKKEDSNG